MTYKIGQRFIDKADNHKEYILSIVEHGFPEKVALICLKNGVPYLDKPVEVMDIKNITEKEFLEICDGDKFDFVLKKEKESSMKDAYLKMQEKSGLKVGDKVKILRKAESYKMGWLDNWLDEMDKYIGEVGEVRNVMRAFGIYVAFEPVGDFYFFPFFVLEKVEEDYYCIGDKFIKDDELFTLMMDHYGGVEMYSFASFECYDTYLDNLITVKNPIRITVEELSEFLDEGFKLYEKSPLRKERS